MLTNFLDGTMKIEIKMDEKNMIFELIFVFFVFLIEYFRVEIDGVSAPNCPGREVMCPSVIS